MTSNAKLHFSNMKTYYEDGEEIQEWDVDEENNRCSCSMYRYSDDLLKMYLANVKTKPEHQRNGLATEMIKAVITYCTAMNMQYLYLWVEAGSWMESWYKKLGFEFLYVTEDSKYVWLYYPFKVQNSLPCIPHK